LTNEAGGMNSIWGVFGRGVCPSIFVLVECTCAVGSNRLNQGPRCIKKGGGGSFQKGGANPNHRGPGATGVFWSLPDLVGCVVASQISFIFILHLNPSF